MIKPYLQKFLVSLMNHLSLDPLARHMKQGEWIEEWIDKNPISLPKEWKDPRQDQPEQGKKVLCMYKGDFYVAQRFGLYWFSIPFYDSEFSRHFLPDLWQEIDFPNDLTGKIHVAVNGKIYDMDELEKEHPDTFDQMVKGQLNLFRKGMKNG